MSQQAIIYPRGRTVLPCAARTEQSTLAGTVPDANTDKAMNERTAAAKATPLEGEEREAHVVYRLRKEIHAFGVGWGGGGGGERSASEPGFCNGNHMAGDCGADAPRLLGEAARQPTPFQKQQEDISSVRTRDDTVRMGKKGGRGPGKGER